MKPPSQSAISRRSLGALLAGAPVVVRGAQDETKSDLEQARESHDSNQKRLKAVKLAREVEPSFRFEP